jgi:hypothetical protein
LIAPYWWPVYVSAMSIDSANEKGEIGNGRHPGIFHRQADISVLPLLF